MGVNDRRPLMVANHKMNMHHLEVIQYIQKLSYRLQPEDTERVEVLIAPVFTNLRTVGLLIETDRIPFGLAAQHVHWEEKGAFTGEVSASMLAKLNCRYVIVGHSERRQFFGETDETVNRRVKAVLSAEMIPIVCVGETEEQKADDQTEEVLAAQLSGALKRIDPDRLVEVVVAYEPVWAIGTGKHADPDQAGEVMDFLRGQIEKLGKAGAAEQVRVIYGGSVNAGNIANFMAKKAIDGALVGGASLDPDKFSAVVRYYV